MCRGETPGGEATGPCSNHRHGRHAWHSAAHAQRRALTPSRPTRICPPDPVLGESRPGYVPTMRRIASIALGSTLAACGLGGEGAHPGWARTPQPGTVVRARPHASSRKRGPRVLRDVLFVLPDVRVWPGAASSADRARRRRPSGARARAIAVATTTLVAATDDGGEPLRSFFGGDGIEWLVQADDGSSTTLFTGAARTRPHTRWASSPGPRSWPRTTLAPSISS